MALITYLTTPQKNTTTIVELNKKELIAILENSQLPIKKDDLNTIIVFYKSRVGKQKKRIEFMFFEDLPKSKIAFHAQSRAEFFLQKILLLNHARDKIVLDRKTIPNAFIYDIEME